MCVCVCKVHEFQVVYRQRTVKLEPTGWGWGWECGGAWLAANAQSRTSTLIAWNVKCVKSAPDSVRECEKRKRRRLGSGCLLAGTPTRCEGLNCSG